jgi:hypothetical protein
MTLKEKMISEAFVGTLCRHKAKFTSATDTSFDGFYELNHLAAQAIFDAMVRDKNFSVNYCTQKVMRTGLKTFFEILSNEQGTTSIFHDVNSQNIRPDWAYNIKRRRYRR